MNHTSESKNQIRKEKIALRKAISAQDRQVADERICQNILSIPAIKKYRSAVAYATDGTEPDLSPVMRYFLENGWTLSLPRFLSKDHYEIAKVKDLCLPGEKWGIPEPGKDAELSAPELLKDSLWLVPGIAFDEHGGRLGRGGGIYDRLLKSGAGLVIGVFYECQKCDSLPMESHDCGMDLIVTEFAVYNSFSDLNLLNKDDKKCH